eukprot:Sdes_comp20367_c0_seq3m14186
MSYSGGYRSSRAQVPVSSVLLTAAQEETTSNTYLFGKTQSFRGLGILSKCFAILVCIETFVVVGLASFRLYKMKFPLSFETRADFTFALLLLINTGFSAYYAIHGCLKERTKEIYAFLFASFIVTCHVCYQYFLQQDPSSEDLDVMFLRRLQFIAVLLFEPLNCVLGVLVAHSFGWISFKIVGADIAFSNMYANYCTFLSFLKVDVQSAVNFVLVNSLLSFVGYVELGFDIAGLIVSLLWAVGCWAAVILISMSAYFSQNLNKQTNKTHQIFIRFVMKNQRWSTQL